MGRIVPADKLNDLMEIDHVIRVHADGTVSEPHDVWAPELYDDHLDTGGKPWVLMNGYSGQDRYSGPVMHNSEFIGGSMADDILAEPGLYVAIIANWSCEEHTDGMGDDDCQCDTAEGWAVARILD